MSPFETREARFAVREFVFLGLAGVGGWLFVNHELLRGQGAPANPQLSWYLLSTIVLYLYIRAIVVVAEMSARRPHARAVRCPECGQSLDDPSTPGRRAHDQIELTPRPSTREVVSAVALRKAVDAARLVPRGATVISRTLPPPDERPIENLTGKDLLAAIDDPDLLERLLHGPNPPRDPRFRR